MYSEDQLLYSFINMVVTWEHTITTDKHIHVWAGFKTCTLWAPREIRWFAMKKTDIQNRATDTRFNKAYSCIVCPCQFVHIPLKKLYTSAICASDVTIKTSQCAREQKWTKLDVVFQLKRKQASAFGLLQEQGHHMFPLDHRLAIGFKGYKTCKSLCL